MRMQEKRSLSYFDLSVDLEDLNRKYFIVDAFDLKGFLGVFNNTPIPNLEIYFLNTDGSQTKLESLIELTNNTLFGIKKFSIAIHN